MRVCIVGKEYSPKLIIKLKSGNEKESSMSKGERKVASCLLPLILPYTRLSLHLFSARPNRSRPKILIFLIPMKIIFKKIIMKNNILFLLIYHFN